MLPERGNIEQSFLKFYISFMAIVIIIVAIAKFNWWISLLGLTLLSVPIYLVEKKKSAAEEQYLQYIKSLSFRLKKVGEEALLEMPIGIMLLDEDYNIEWTNPYLARVFKRDTIVNCSLYELSDDLVSLLKSEKAEEVVEINNYKYQVVNKQTERLLYFFDVTEKIQVERRYESEKPVIATIYLDNYDELTQGVDDQTRSSINSFLTKILNKWALEANIYLKRVASDRFVAFFNEEILAEQEEIKFSLLDEVRKQVLDQNIPLTLSIGVGVGKTSLPELGKLSQQGLDLALGRGGDQVVIKYAAGQVKFYGGKTNPIEKRTRVRARVISQALQQLIKESDQIIVMGHKQPDMDAIGSAIGIKKMAELNGLEGYIVLDDKQIQPDISRLMDEISNREYISSFLVNPEEALNKITENTLLVIVDTHKRSLVIEEKLLSKTDKIVILDHHRRAEDYIEDATLVYMEPYASSTAELVTELLEYQPQHRKLTSLEATLLLAGIIVDTKNFTMRTGSRTFDAASFLRTLGADTIFVQKLLKEDLQAYIAIAKLIETVYFYKKGIAITMGNEEETFNPVILAQTADKLLAIDKVAASFVISLREDGKIGISARSLGEINVQVIMEMLGGGGHLTNAAVQIENVTIAEVEIRLKSAIDQYLEGSN